MIGFKRGRDRIDAILRSTNMRKRDRSDANTQSIVKKFFIASIPVIFTLIILCAFLWVVDSHPQFIIKNFGGEKYEIPYVETFHNASLIILTFIIACIAWIQLSGIKQSGQANFLLQIDKRYSDPTIIKARKIIHLIKRPRKKISTGQNSNTASLLQKKLTLWAKLMTTKLNTEKKILIMYIF